MIGRFQVYNVIAAASICVALGMDPDLIFKSLCYLKPARGRMESSRRAALRKNKNLPKLIDAQLPSKNNH